GDQVERLAGLFAGLTTSAAINESRANSPMTVAPFLRDLLPKVPAVRRLAATLFDQRIVSLEGLARSVWGADNPEPITATTLLLRLSAAARVTPQELPLVPHRLHFLVRGPEGLSCCLNEGCTGPAEVRVKGAGSLQSSSDRCAFCQAATLPL